MPCIGLHMGEWKHSVTWPYPERVILHGGIPAKVRSTIYHQDSQGPATNRWPLRMGMCCSCEVSFVFPGVSEILTGSVPKYPKLLNFLCQRYFDHILLLDYLILFALEWTFNKGLHGVQVLQVSLSLTARCQVKFAACAQASWFDPCELLNHSVWP